ncbi:MAG: GNAT family N-acetyltransferase [Pirellulaceae bacterium]|jgi:acyl-CoA hydrolase/GNAT superfamily N-acetyltransferase|nr:GNAT family N-acetyltransferase [Pirellulaceae bacterium]
MATDWRDSWQDKITTAAAAIKHIRPGDRVFVGSACGEPQELVRALVDTAGGPEDTEVLNVLTMGVAPYTDPKYSDRFRANAFFIGNSVRAAVGQVRADYTPIFFSQIPEMFRSGRLPIDVALIMVSPPDQFGFCSLGVSVDMTRAAALSAKLVVAQVNKHMPRTLGNSFVHVRDINYLVPHDEPLLTWPVIDNPDDTTRRIASNVASLISDGDTLQLGIGRLPDTVLSELTDRNDLGIHTEMFSDGIIRLVKQGVITGRHKTLHQGKIVGSFAAGTQELFDFLDNNPMFEMHPSEYTNDPRVISQHDNLAAINSAIEIDLTGQAVADSIGEQLYSGIGGHADFMRGAAMARRGKPILALPSTAKTKDGMRSRIVPFIQLGAGVVTTRGDVHYVVTEHGVAYLHGKTMRERAMALISIAHPDFRAELLHAAKRRRLVYADQILPPLHPYPSHLESRYTTKDGGKLLIRPIRPSDEDLIKDMFYSFSEQTKYLRYHGTLKAMPHNKVQVFCNVDYDTEMALVAVRGTGGDEEIVAVGRYMTTPAKRAAEMAFVVADSLQRQGLGTYLFHRLIEIGKQEGIKEFHADVLPENSGMLKIFHRSGLNTETSTEEGVVSVRMKLEN